MKTGMITLMLIGAFAWPLAGCHSPTRVADSVAMKRHSMPESWVYESSRSGKVKALPRALRDRLQALRDDMVVEQGTRYFSFYGHYTPEMQARIDSMNAACTESYLVSDIAIASNLTPELQSMTMSDMDMWWDDQISFDIQRREFVDDWRSLWMTDSPSILNRLPIVDTAHP